MSRRKKKKQNFAITLILILLIAIYFNFESEIKSFVYTKILPSYSRNDIPEYNGQEFIYLNNNEPYFKEEDKKDNSYEKYSKLDSLNRAGTALALLGEDLMPEEEREPLLYKPSGFQTTRYDDIVPGKYLYNRCHLIGFQLSGENDNPQNLITCTRQMNTGKMLDLENEVAEYIKNTHNHVLYRVTPFYEDINLIASGIEMEALSLEDNGKGIKFNVYIYNVQEGIDIDYLTGDSKISE